VLKWKRVTFTQQHIFIHGLFNDAYSIKFAECRMGTFQMNWNLEVSSCSLIEAVLRNFHGDTEENKENQLEQPMSWQ
jgi:hypothetical protein